MEYRAVERGRLMFSERGAQVSLTKERLVEVVASTDEFDRYGESIAIGGWDLKNFRRNPVILFGHDHQQVVGVAEKVWRYGKKLKMRVRFARAGASVMADEVYALVKDGIIQAVSVGFAPLKWKDTDRGRVFTAVELLECSFVSVPANPSALVEVKAQEVEEEEVEIEEEEEIEEERDYVLKKYRKAMVQMRDLLELQGVADEVENMDNIVRRAREVWTDNKELGLDFTGLQGVDMKSLRRYF